MLAYALISLGRAGARLRERRYMPACGFFPLRAQIVPALWTILPVTRVNFRPIMLCTHQNIPKTYPHPHPAIYLYFFDERRNEPATGIARIPTSTRFVPRSPPVLAPGVFPANLPLRPTAFSSSGYIRESQPPRQKKPRGWREYSGALEHFLHARRSRLCVLHPRQIRLWRADAAPLIPMASSDLLDMLRAIAAAGMPHRPRVRRDTRRSQVGPARTVATASIRLPGWHPSRKRRV